MAEGSAVLVIGPQWVGDMVMAQVLFTALKEKHPGAPIDVMAPAWAAPILSRMPEVRAAIETPFSRRKLDLAKRWRMGRSLKGRYGHAYVMQGSWKSALVPLFAGIPRRTGHLREMRYGLLNDIRPLPKSLKRKTAAAFRTLAGDDGRLVPPHLTIDAASQRRLLAQFGLEAGRFVALMPGAEFGPAKRWPPRHYAAFAEAMEKRGFKVALLGSPNDRETTAEIAGLVLNAVDVAGQTRLEDAIDILGAAKLAVTNDSGLMHVAAAVGVPVIAVYGSTSPDNTPPLADRRELLWLALPCSPCHKRVCPLGHLDCLETLRPDRVIAAADRLLAAGEPG